MKKFLTNKNTVTFLAAIAVVVTLYIGYNYRINQAVTLVPVPVAKHPLASGKVITDDDIRYVKVSQKTVNDDLKAVVRDKSQIIGQKVAYGSPIPANSFFFSSALIEQAAANDRSIEDIQTGQTVFSLPLTDKTRKTGFVPGQKIDLYIKGRSYTGKVLVSKFIENIEILDVRDDQGIGIREASIETSVPSYLLFAVDDNLHFILEKAKRIGTFEIEPVLYNNKYDSSTGDDYITNAEVKKYIEDVTTSDPNS